MNDSNATEWGSIQYLHPNIIWPCSITFHDWINTLTDWLITWSSVRGCIRLEGVTFKNMSAVRGLMKSGSFSAVDVGEIHLCVRNCFLLINSSWRLCLFESPGSISEVRCQVMWVSCTDNMTEWWMVVRSLGLVLSLVYFHRDGRLCCTPFRLILQNTILRPRYVLHGRPLNTKVLLFPQSSQLRMRIIEGISSGRTEDIQQNEK